MEDDETLERDPEDEPYGIAFSAPDVHRAGAVDGRGVLVIDYHKQEVMCRLELPHVFHHIGMSPGAKLLAVASTIWSEDDESRSSRYRLAVYSIRDEQLLGSIDDGHINGHATLKAVSVDDQGRRISTWW